MAIGKMFEDNGALDDNLINFHDLPPVNVVKKRPARIPDILPIKRAKSPVLTKNILKRKFPGPAGVLPDRNHADFSILKPPNGENCSDEISYTQTSISVFQNDPWLKMHKDFASLHEKYNIKWIKSQAALNKLTNQKAPFLAAVIQNIDCFDGKVPIINVTLKDLTGYIQGTIIHNLYEEYSDYLTVGSVIILRQVGVLTTGNNKNHYLTITPNNLMKIYSKNKSNTDNDEATIINLRPVDCDDVIDDLLIIQVMEAENRKAEETRAVGEGMRSIFDSTSDNLDLSLIEDSASKPKKFIFKKTKNESVTLSQDVSIKTSVDHREIWQSVLDGIDTDQFFEDF